jgi:tetratricopeptide (TPR) repeat protein
MAKKGEKALQRAEEYQRDGVYHMAIEAYEEAISSFKEDQNFSRQADALTSLGDMYDLLLSDYQKALETYQQSLRLRQMYGLRGLCQEYLNVAVQQNFLGKFSEAKDNLERGRHSAEREDNQKTLGRILNLLGDILIEEGYLDEAEEHLRVSLELLTELGDDRMISHVQSSIGLLLACHNRHNEAQKACQNALDMAEEISSAGAVGTAHLRFGQARWLSGDFSGAREHLQKALEAAQKTNIKILQETALDWLDRCGLAKPPNTNSVDDT